MKNKGITLIALVITIAVLIILAGVTINLTLGENGIFNKAKYAEELLEKSAGKEILIVKIYDYQVSATTQNQTPTLQGLKEYLKDDEKIEYIDLYVEEESTYAKVKLKEYKYEYILNEKLEILEEEKELEEPYLKEVGINSELQALLDEANMQITLEDILNTPAIMDTIPGLIPTISETDVTRSEVDGIVTYTRSEGGIIRTNSDYNSNSVYPWNAFDGNINTKALSKIGKAADYYLEYEFVEEVYAMNIKFNFTNGSSYKGDRTLVVQAYDEEAQEYKDLGEELTWSGTSSTKKEDTQDLDYSKPHKKYRIYVKTATSNNSYGNELSGFYEIQLYGTDASKVNSNSEENLKKALLSSSSLSEITLSNMITNEDFTRRLVNTLSIDTVKKSETLINNLPSLIPIISETDVTRSEVDGIVTYTRSEGGIIRTNSDYNSNSVYPWNAFDGNINTKALSKIGKAADYYLEYEFVEEVYAMNIKFNFTNGSSYKGDRTLVVQAYDEEAQEYKDLGEELTWSGTSSTKKEDTQDLDYSKPHKKYRIYVKTATSNNSYGNELSGFYEIQLYGKVVN